MQIIILNITTPTPISTTSTAAANGPARCPEDTDANTPAPGEVVQVVDLVGVPGVDVVCEGVRALVRGHRRVGSLEAPGNRRWEEPVVSDVAQLLGVGS
jgi:hypothetical protein